MKTRTLVYLALLFLCVVIGVVTLALYYSQNFTETFSLKENLKLSEIKYEAYDQGNYNNYNCAYDESGIYKCDQSQSNVRLLQSASVEVGTVTLKNEGVFTQVYEPLRLIGCIEFANPIASNGQQFPTLFSIEYVPSDKTKSYSYSYNYYGQYTYPGSQIEIKQGKTATYTLVAHYQSYSIPLEDFNGDNIKQVKIYQVPTKENNPLGEGYDYSSFSRNPSCENAKQKDIAPLKVIKIG